MIFDIGLFITNYVFLKISVIHSAPRYSKRYFKVACSGPCQDINIRLEYSTGDADLCAR